MSNYCSKIRFLWFPKLMATENNMIMPIANAHTETFKLKLCWLAYYKFSYRIKDKKMRLRTIRRVN